MGQVEYISRESDGMIGKILDSMVGRVIDFDNSGVIVFNRHAAPVILHDNFSDIVEREQFDSFLSHSYVLSPIYQSIISQEMPSVLTARELASRVPFHQDLPYLLSLHISMKPNAISDEIYITVSNETNRVCYVAIRTALNPHFSECDVQQVKSIAPKVQDLLEHFLSLVTLPVSGKKLSHTAVNANVQEASAHPLAVPSELGPGSISSMDIDEMFKDRLSPREHASISMTLQGNSVDNIAYMLNISPHTVRVHMRNAYSKLRVRNRLELFAMFLRQAGFIGKSRT
jgi:DNA-binding CsgD family transcriptional regulator